MTLEQAENLARQMGAPEPQFHVGDRVCAISFVDCFGKHVDAQSGLTVMDVRLVQCTGMPSYYRILAERGIIWIEGAERFFQHEQAVNNGR